MTPEDHKLLSETSRGTPMGELLRRYWSPVCLSREIESDGAPLRVRLMGEDLIAFRDTRGRVGLLREFCAHRGASLYLARNGNSRLTCWYHGWAWDIEGNCLDQPNMPEDRRFCDKVKQPAYPCVERGQAVWAYLGPRESKPPLHELEWLLLPDDHVYVNKRLQYCHWTQGMDGDLDSSHVAFLHAHADTQIKGPNDGQAAKWRDRDLAPKYEVAAHPAGLIHGARRRAGEDTYYWRVGQWFFPGFTTIPPSGGDAPLTGHSWTPIDDTRTHVFCWAWHPTRPLTDKERATFESGDNFFAPLIPGQFRPRANDTNDYAGPDAPPAKQPWMRVKSFQGQDQAATESMGPLYDRTQENLGAVDLLIVRTRQALIDAARGLQKGNEPPGRDPRGYRLRPVSVTLPRAVNDWTNALAAPMSARPETFVPSV
jgi:phenylpropionate dioxygenase-like ring-hydroxylating dioxygenase large terminal subunit